MALLEEISEAALFVRRRGWEPRQPSGSNPVAAYARGTQLEWALKLSGLALGRELGLSKWVVYGLPMGITVAMVALPTGDAVPRRGARVAIRAQHHFSDLCNGVCVIASIALLKQGKYAQGAAPLCLIPLYTSAKKGWLPQALLPCLSYALSAARWAPTALESWSGLGKAVAFVGLWRLVAVGPLGKWLVELAFPELKPADLGEFQPRIAPTDCLEDLEERLGAVQNLPHTLGKVLGQSRMRVHFLDSGLSAQQYCEKGLKSTLAAAKRQPDGSLLPQWLGVLAADADHLSQKNLMALCLSGHVPQRGGAVVYNTYCRHTGIDAHDGTEVGLAGLKYWKGISPPYRLDGKPPPKPTLTVVVIAYLLHHYSEFVAHIRQPAEEEGERGRRD